MAAGTIARMFLRELGVEVSGYVRSVADVSDEKEYTFEELKSVKDSELFMPFVNVRCAASMKLRKIRIRRAGSWKSVLRV